MQTIYVVMGTCGEYSDRTEWPVAAYESKALAEEHEFAATLRAKEFQKTPAAEEYSFEGFQEWMKELDPDPCEWTLTADYFILAVPVRTEVPKP